MTKELIEIIDKAADALSDASNQLAYARNYINEFIPEGMNYTGEFFDIMSSETLRKCVGLRVIRERLIEDNDND